MRFAAFSLSERGAEHRIYRESLQVTGLEFGWNQGQQIEKKEAGPPVCYFDMRKQANITHQQDQPCLLFCQAFILSINTFPH
jgi:hypothetical protein